MSLKVSVFDTYVPKRQGGLMHFDILVDADEKDLEKIYSYGKQYLMAKGQEGQAISSTECNFCHIENAGAEVENAILKKGYHIIEMEGCD